MNTNYSHEFYVVPNFDILKYSTYCFNINNKYLYNKIILILTGRHIIKMIIKY